MNIKAVEVLLRECQRSLEAHNRGLVYLTNVEQNDIKTEINRLQQNIDNHG